MNDLLNLDLASARDALNGGSISSLELTQAYIAAMEAARPLNCYITETAEQALRMAGESDRRRSRGEGGALEGLPIGMKDLFCTEGVETTAGSRILKGFCPAYESTVGANLWRAGAVLLGKLNMDEFAMGSANLNSHFGPVISPWRRADDAADAAATLTPGGSSGGSAAAVAAHACLAATGTDTGGSIRQPAAFCGVVGLKPTYGRCSRRGIVAFASSLDQAGPITRTVRDAALMLGAMAGFDAGDSTSVDRPVPDYAGALSGGIKGLRIGVPKEYRVEGMPEAISALWQQGMDWLAEAGAVTVDISLPHTHYALPAYYIVAPAEASSNLARYDGVRYGFRAPDAESLDAVYARTRGAGFGEEVKRRILIGAYVLSAGYYDAYYLKAQKVRTRIADDFRAAWQKCDLILSPATPSAAFAIDAPPDDPVQMYMNDVFTVPASLAGLPGIAVPAGLDEAGLPLGLQLIGRAFDEETLLRAAGVLEAAAGFSARPALRVG